MKNYLTSFILVIMLSLVQPLMAADDCGGLPLCPGYGDDVPGVTCCLQVPFDGGIMLMLAAGAIGMGVRAMRKRVKNSIKC